MILASSISITLFGLTHWRINKTPLSKTHKILNNEEEGDSRTSYTFYTCNINSIQRRLSVDKIFPRVVAQEKKANLEGTFNRHTNFQGNEMPSNKEDEWQWL